MKKFLAILLTVCLLAGMFTFAASAAEVPAVTKVEVIDAGKVVVYFNEAVDASADGAWAAFYFSADGSLDFSNRLGLNWASTSADRKVMTFTAPSFNAVDAVTKTGTFAGNAPHELYFAFDGNGMGSPVIASGGTAMSYDVTIANWGAKAHTSTDIVYEPVEIIGATILSSKSIALHFSEAVTCSNFAGPWFSVAYKNESAMDIGGTRTGCVFESISADAKTVYIKAADSIDFIELFENEVAGSNFIVAVDGDAGGSGYPITAADGYGVLKNYGVMIPTYQSCSYTENVSVDDAFIIEEVSFINSGIVAVEFSESAAFSGQPWGAFYFRDKATGALVGSRIGAAYRNESTIGNTAYYTTADGWDAYNRTGAYETYTKDAYDLVFAFDNYAVPGNGYVTSLDGLWLAPNNVAPGNGRAHVCDNITDEFGYVDPAFEVTEGFRVVSATAINDKQIVIEMSEPVHMVDPYAYISLRYTDNFGYLVMDGSTPLQFGGRSVISGDGMRITWTINETGNLEGCNNVIDAVTFAGKLAKYSEYVPMMSIEEIKSIDDNGTVAHVFNDEGEELIANRVYSKAEGGADAAYVPVSVNTKWEDPGLLPLEVPAMPKGPHIVKAVAANDKQLVVEFSEPITFVAPYGFMAIRYVDRNFNLGFDGETPLQFYGRAVVSLDRKSVVWSLADEGNIGNVDNLADILNRTGKLAKYKDYYPVFGLEEIIDGKDNDSLIENVVNDKGEKLVANCPTDLGYDRVYVTIEFNNAYNIPDTGDNVNVYLLCAGLAVSVLLAGAVVIKRKRTQA